LKFDYKKKDGRILLVIEVIYTKIHINNYEGENENDRQI
jgi:hypothetical protein